MNNKFAPSIINDSESPSCLNVVFSSGGVGTREGFVKVNTAAVSTHVCDGLYVRKGTSNAETMVAFFNGTGFTLNTTSFITIGSAQSVFTGGVRVGSSQMENHIFFGTGGVIPYKYNGTDFTRHGVYPPTDTTTMNSGGAGVLIGDYRYKFTYRNSQTVEGNPSTATVTFAATSVAITFVCLPIAPQSWGVASRRIYRTVSSGSTFLLVTTISDNTTTTYTDNTADASLGAVAPSDKGVPPNYSIIVFHQRRMFVNDNANGNLIYYSDLDEPYTFGSASFLTVGDSSTDFIKAIEVHNDSLVVFGERNVWLVYMQDTTPANWQVIKAESSYTSKSPFGAFTYNNKLAFPAMQNDKFAGIGAISGAALEPNISMLTVSNVGSELKSDRIEPDMFDIQEAYVGNISSIVFKNKAFIAMTKASGSTTNNRVYVMDFSVERLAQDKHEAWIPWSGLNVAQFAIYSGNLYYGTSTATGFVYKLNSGVYTDDGSAINSYMWTKEFAGLRGEASFNKDFRYTNMLVDLAGDYFMDFSYKVDSDTGTGTRYQVNLDPGSSLWGTMIWGVDNWGGGSNQKDIRVYLANARGKRIQFYFSNQNTAAQRFMVHWQNFTYNLKGPR